MNCPNCGIGNNDTSMFCRSCGTALTPPAEETVQNETLNVNANVNVPPVAPQNEAGWQSAPAQMPPMQAAPPVYYQNYPQQPTYTPAPPAKPTIPEQYQPMSPWAYFGLSILFSVPIVGFIFLIVFSFSDGNLNRRNYARSYFCGLLIVGIIVAVYLILTLLLVGSLAGAFEVFEGGYYY